MIVSLFKTRSENGIIYRFRAFSKGTLRLFMRIAKAGERTRHRDG